MSSLLDAAQLRPTGQPTGPLRVNRSVDARLFGRCLQIRLQIVQQLRIHKLGLFLQGPVQEGVNKFQFIERVLRELIHGFIKTRRTCTMITAITPATCGDL
jgi:hypothetical protein